MDTTTEFDNDDITAVITAADNVRTNAQDNQKKLYDLLYKHTFTGTTITITYAEWKGLMDALNGMPGLTERRQLVYDLMVPRNHTALTTSKQGDGSEPWDHWSRIVKGSITRRTP